jgi:hypothetical protein
MLKIQNNELKSRIDQVNSERATGNAEDSLVKYQLVEAKTQLEAAQRTIQNLRKEIDLIEAHKDDDKANDIQQNYHRSQKAENSNKYLRSQLNEQIEQTNRIEVELRMEKEEKEKAFQRITLLEKELNAQGEFFKQQIQDVLDYNAQLQTNLTEEKKKFIFYLQKHTQMQADRQENKINKQKDLLDDLKEAKKVIKLLHL